MSMQRIKIGDTVTMLTGKDKGKSGDVTHINKGRVRVRGLNLQKKHVKPNPQKNEQGGIMDKEASVDASNVALLNPRSKKSDKVGFKVVDGKKVRFYKSDDELIDL